MTLGSKKRAGVTILHKRKLLRSTELLTHRPHLNTLKLLLKISIQSSNKQLYRVRTLQKFHKLLKQEVVWFLNKLTSKSLKKFKQSASHVVAVVLWESAVLSVFGMTATMGS